MATGSSPVTSNPVVKLQDAGSAIVQSLRSHQFVKFEVAVHETIKNQKMIIHTKWIEIVQAKIIPCQVKPLGPQRPKMTWEENCRKKMAKVNKVDKQKHTCYC